MFECLDSNIRRKKENMSDSQVETRPQAQDDSLKVSRDPDAQKQRGQTRRINSIETEQIPHLKKDSNERDYSEKKIDLNAASTVRNDYTIKGSSYVRKEPGVLKDSISQNELKKPRKSESVKDIKREELMYKEERHAAFFPRRMIPRGGHGVQIPTNIHDQYDLFASPIFQQNNYIDQCEYLFANFVSLK